MEALVKHCVNEVAHDGDLGSTVPRVGSFINEFYERNPPPSDEDRASFQSLFDALTKEPHIVVGLAPSASTEVVIGVPEKAKKWAQNKKPASTVASTSSTPLPADAAAPSTAAATPEAEPGAETLEIIEVTPNTLAIDLVATHGDRLRIAVDAEYACYVLTAMPNRSMPRTNPRMYTCLQFISRARANGMSADNLSLATGYDQKICYHHIRHLVSLDIIFKVRRNDLTRVDYCIHRDFRAFVPEGWSVRGGKDKLETPHTMATRDSGADDADAESGSERLDPKDQASPGLLRERVVSVLKEAGVAIPYTQLFAAAGYSKAAVRFADGSDWEFFCGIVEDMVSDGTLFKALKKANGGGPVLCIRLPNGDPPDPVAASMKPSRMRPRRVTQNGAALADDDGDSMGEGPSTAVAKRPADDAPPGEPPLKRKRGRPRKEEVEARNAAAAAAEGRAKKDEPREPTPPWAARRKAGVRLPSPPWVPKRIPTPPWTEGDKPGRPVTPPPPEKVARLVKADLQGQHDPESLAKMDKAAQLELVKGMIEQLEQRNEAIIAGSQLLTAKDMKTLLPGNLPNSAVLDALNSMMMITTASLPRVYIGSTALYPAIIEALSEHPHGADLRAWGKVLKLQERINLFGLHRFIVPVNLKGRWTCACVDFKGTMISIYDSMPKPTETMQMTTIRALSTWLDHESKARNHPPPDWKVWKADSAPRDVIKSESTADSGFYTWLFARNLIMQERIDMNFRLEVAGERIWLLVDALQSLERTPALAPGALVRVSSRPPPAAPGSPTQHVRRPSSQQTPAGAPRPPVDSSRPPHAPAARPPPLPRENGARPPEGQRAAPPQPVPAPQSQPRPDQQQQQPQAPPSTARTSPEQQRRMSQSQASSASTPGSRTTQLAQASPGP